MIRRHFQRQAGHNEQLVEKLFHVIVPLCGRLDENAAIVLAVAVLFSLLHRHRSVKQPFVCYVLANHDRSSELIQCAVGGIIRG